MTLLAPLGLVALTALAIPLLMQLIRRSDERRIPFAALRYVADRQRPRKSPRIERWLLLVLRWLLLAAVAMLLSIPVWRQTGTPGPHWIAYAPGTMPASMASSAAAPPTEHHWLLPGFPSADIAPPADAASRTAATTDTAKAASIASISSLIRQLDADLPPATMLSIVVPEHLAGLDAERLRLGHVVDWQIQPGRASPGSVVAGDTRLHVAIRSAPSAVDLPVVQALIAAWQHEGLAINVDFAPPAVALGAGTDWLFWLGTRPDASVHAFIRAGGLALLTGQGADSVKDCDTALADAAGGTLICARTRGLGQERVMAAALTPAADPQIADAEFPSRLLALLQASSPAPDQALAATVAPQRSAGIAPAKTPMDAAFAALAALLFLLERLLATRRRRVTAA